MAWISLKIFINIPEINSIFQFIFQCSYDQTIIYAVVALKHITAEFVQKGHKNDFP
jgi:hypothetical protein